MPGMEQFSRDLKKDVQVFCKMTPFVPSSVLQTRPTREYTICHNVTMQVYNIVIVENLIVRLHLSCLFIKLYQK